MNDGASTQAGQLGFWGKGTGGTHPSDAAKRGDQIWEWKDDTWHRYWMMDDHGAGTDHDGKWWDSEGEGAGTYADFALEPGYAYYYQHTTNWSATNFVWEPEAP